MKKPFKAFLSAILLVMLFITVQVIGSGIIGGFYGYKIAVSGGEFIQEDVANYMYSNVNLLVIINYTLLPLLTLMIFAIRKVKVREYIKTAKFDGKLIPVIACFALGTQLLSGILIQLLSLVLSTQNGMEAMQNAIKSDNLLLGLISLSIFAPIVEEFFFRGVIFTKLKNHMNVKVALVIQALLFSLVHFNLAQMLPTIVLGLVTGILYLKYEDIKVPILLHMVYNTYAVIVGNLPESAYPVCGLIVIAASIASIVILVRMRKEEHKKEDIEAIN